MPSNPLSAANMAYRIDSVRFSSIDCNDLTYQISTPTPVDRIAQSISRIGLINPPILSQTKHSGYQIVSGFRRITACQGLGGSGLTARILSPDMAPLHILGLAIADNAQHRDLNLIEQATAIDKLGRYLNDDTDILNYGNSLGMQLNRAFIGRLRRLNNLSRSIKDAVASNTVPLTIALELEKLDAASAEELSFFFEELRPTLNQQKEMVSLVKEIARLEDRLIPELIKAGPVGGIRADTDLDRTQKIKRIRSSLKKRRYPSIHQFEVFFDRSLKALDLPRDIGFSPPADFEGNRFSVTISFHSQAEFKTHIETLFRLAENPHFIAIVEKQIDDQEALY